MNLICHPCYLIHYYLQSGALLERMAATGVDIISLDWTVTMEEGRRRIGKDLGVQGNLDPAILFAPHDVIKASISNEWMDASANENGSP